MIEYPMTPSTRVEVVVKLMECWDIDNKEKDGDRSYQVASFKERLRQGGIPLPEVNALANIACRSVMEMNEAEQRVADV